MRLQPWDYLLWFVTPLLQAGVIFAMYRRNLHSLYPRFFAYTILQVLSVPVLALLFYRSYTQYYYSYWVNLSLSVLLSFAVVYEASRIIFDQDERSLKVLQILWTAVVLIGFLMLGVTTPPSHSMNSAVTDSLMLADRALRIFQVVLLIGFSSFIRWLRLSSRSFVYGIVLGFGLFAFISMLVEVVVRHPGVFSVAALSRMNSFAYLVSVLIWLAYSCFGSPQPGGLDTLEVEASADREIREWLDRNFKDPRMSAVRARNLI